MKTLLIVIVWKRRYFKKLIIRVNITVKIKFSTEIRIYL